MATAYEIWFQDDEGNRIGHGPLDTFEVLSWSQHINTSGGWSLRFAAGQFDRSLFRLNRRVEIWRKPEGGSLYLVMIGFMRYLERGDVGANSYVVIGGPDSNDLLVTRIIDADTGAAGSDKAGTADDIMKEYVDEQLGGGAAAGRDITAWGFSVQAALSLGPAITKVAARRNLLRTLQELAETAYQLDDPVYFNIVNPTTTTFEFRTYTGQPGLDRRYSATNYVLMSAENDSLTRPVLYQDWSREITYIYAGGSGTGNTRTVQEVEDTERLNAARFNRREALLDGTTYGADAAALDDAARKALRELRPGRQFRADIVDVPGNRLGLDWQFGDRVTESYEEELYDALIAAVSGTFDGTGESIEAVLDYAE